MSAFADPSFLFALYRRQPGNDRAVEWLERNPPPLVNALVVFEFTQAVRFEIFRHSHDHNAGFPEITGVSILAQFEEHIARGVLGVGESDAARILAEATRLSEAHTIREGTRAFDLLHVASALVSGAREFLSFDAVQRTLAEAEGLILAPPVQDESGTR